MPVSEWDGQWHFEPYFAREKEKLDSSGARTRDARMYARTRERHYDTTTFAVRKMREPRLGINVTSTEQLPFRRPFTLVPTNVQLRMPRTMVKRMEPCEVFGIARATCCATTRALRYRPRFTVR